jgi:hypothetical protein
MSDSLVINLENHRSKKRIEEMGEVFTPDKYVLDMLQLIDSKSWKDESTIFFEPTCGHGNFVIGLAGQRFECLYKKYSSENNTNRCLRALANTINSIWAIDICPENIWLTRKRLVQFAISTLEAHEIKFNSPKTRGYMAHILCCVQWQIFENEALSALYNNPEIAKRLTKLGNKWLQKNKAIELDFNKSWVSFYNEKTDSGVIAKEYLKALRVFDNLLSGKSNRDSAFKFVDDIKFKSTPFNANKGVA